MRDALVAGLTLDTFNRHADKVAMANVAQLINNLHSLFLAHEDKFVATPNFHVFEMYAAHHGGKSLRTVFNVPELVASQSGRAKPPLLAGSASLHERQLVLTVINTHASDPQQVAVRLRGASVKAASARVLAANDIHAHNTFAEPDAVKPVDANVEARNSTFAHTFPPASITLMTLELG
jgi:alpha-N-arabinofuranosidase